MISTTTTATTKTNVLFLLASSIIIGMVYSQSCVIPTGIDDDNIMAGGPPSIPSQRVYDLLGGILGDPLPTAWVPLADPFIQELVSTYETPIQFRQTVYHGMNNYNVAAMYHPTALNVFGLGDNRICDVATIGGNYTTEQRNAHEQVAQAYAFAYSAITVAPGCTDDITFLMNVVLGFPMEYLDDPSAADTSTPWGLAKFNIDLMADHAKDDGWNADGQKTHDYNKMPFSDFDILDFYTAYSPTPNNKGYLKNTCDKKWYWEPLLETDNAGYFTRQEHVTPFAGFTGRKYGLTHAEYDSFTVTPPAYNYCEEANFVLDETMQMATDDIKKVEIEFFDSKFTSLLPMQIGWSFQNLLSNFDFWFYDMALVVAMYDATLLVWREKINFDGIRPTTVVHYLKNDVDVTTWAGPLEGVKTFKGIDWQPYIRTMPHAEFPSGSSCICTAFAETMVLLTGQNDTGIPLQQYIPAGSSKTEPGVTPATNMTLSYTSWPEVQEKCGKSRLYGGMHFSKAVPGGEELCSGVADIIVARADMLKLGNPAGAMTTLGGTM